MPNLSPVSINAPPAINLYYIHYNVKTVVVAAENSRLKQKIYMSLLSFNGDILTFTPSDICTKYVDSQQDNAEYVLQEFLHIMNVTNEKAIIIINCSDLTFYKVMQLYRHTTSCQRERGANMFKGIPTKFCRIIIPSRYPLLFKFIKTCIEKYVSNKMIQKIVITRS